MTSDHITVHGARQHNLKNINIQFPRNKLTVLTGLSGSGKSTLAFDTLYAEGQRRYVESLSVYARQFLERLEKPDVDLIEGLSPAIAIEQKRASHNPRSTVGTVTETYDFLRLLYARAGTAHCYQCNQPVSAQTLDQMLDKITAYPQGAKMVILSPLPIESTKTHQKLFRRLQREGFARVRLDGKVFELDEIALLPQHRPQTLEVVVDRIVLKPSIRNRVADSLELALSQSEGTAMVHILPDVPEQKGETLLFNEKAACSKCGVSYDTFTPASFSFNSPHGACPACDGLGATTRFVPDLIVPNPELSLREGAILPWANRATVHFTEFLESLTAYFRTDIYTPYKALPENFTRALMFGTDQLIPFHHEKNGGRQTEHKTLEGIIPKLKRQYRETDSAQIRDELRQYMTFRPCESCNGAKLKKESLSVKVGGHGIHEMASQSVDRLLTMLGTIKITGHKAAVAQKIRTEIVHRLGFLKSVGLGYLTLDRAAHTLSGGESQRIRLATQVGSKLTGVLYVLDEPSIGLHPKDNRQLLNTLLEMRDLGNTVLVVEHDEETIRAADHVVDMGPGAGIKGGEVIFSGIPEKIVACEKSLTGQYMAGKKEIAIPIKRRAAGKNSIVVEGACANNLKNITVEFPLGCFVCVTGVSGSGKSTLMLETLLRAAAQRLYHARISAGAHRNIRGLSNVDRVINIDQSPIGKTPRSNPGTYTGVFNHIRDIFARTPDARLRGYPSGRFSFNVKGGRCEACKGDGIIKIEMHFLPDVYVPCDVCGGRRYNRETLEIRYKGKNIDDVLNMTVNQSLSFFENIGKIRTKLQTLVDVGLGYIKLGQPATTLSGGEAQRVKLSRELSKRDTGKTLYLLDEPTTGLHIHDISHLLAVLERLVDAGNTVIVIEHNLDVIKTADHIIDLGPEGGDAGGHIVAVGTPGKIIQNPQSHTGRFLKKILGPHKQQSRIP